MKFFSKYHWVWCAMLIFAACKDSKDQVPAPTSFLDALVLENDRMVERYLSRQNTDESSRDFGGFPDNYFIYHPGSATSIMQRLAAAFVSEASDYHHSDTLLQRMLLATDFVLGKQHEDGTIDLLSTNFHSTPDLGFAVERMALAYRILVDDGHPASADLLKKCQSFLQKAGEALVVGGIHTPNHRWVVSMALSWLYELFADERYKNRAEQWLNEKIDIDADGQFTERSSSVYSPLTDRSLITIARLLDRQDLYEAVRKNLEMSMYYMHPNGEVVTEASRRQDQYQAKFPTAYYYPYRYMWVKDHDATFGGMVAWLEQKLTPAQLAGSLIYLLADPPSADTLSSTVPLPTRYVKHFPHSDLVRLRDGDLDATILAGNPAFFTMHKGSAVLQAVRLASAFFGKGQFKADTLLVVDDDKFILKQHLEGPYYQPYPVDSLPGDGDWEKMPRSNRSQSEVQILDAHIEITKVNGGFVLNIDLSGTDHVPVALELAFRSGGKLDGVRTAPVGGSSYLLKGEKGSFLQGNSTILFGPGKQEHEWTQLRGADEKLEAESVYITGYTPFNYQLRLE